ncbi:MAG TPA: type IV pilus secretin PilQ, partial [Halomonas sp.]|nr:type IV pilus secretin PilQ [Halomonas sp.]
MVVMLRLITLPLLALMPAFALGSVLTDLDVRSTSGGEVELVLQFSGGVAELHGYRLNTPPRLALDLADTQSSLPQRRINVDSAGVERITALEGNGRTRLVVDLSEPLDYTSRIEGDQLRITLSPESTSATNDNSPAGMSSELETALGPQVTDIDFQRGADGAGRLLVSFDREGVVTQVREGSEGRVIAELRDVDIPDSLNQIYDVTDFATPITRITPRTGQRETLLELQTNGPYAMISSQSGRTLTVEVQPVSQASQQDRAQQGESFTGDRLSLNFQDIEVRAVLATLAEFTGLNLVASDSVTGRVTLNLNDVPWDQALALILQSQGLSSREQGNVIVVAPASELAEIERQEIEARSQQQILAPLVTEFIEIKYARAEDLAQLLRGGDGFGLLTERGRVSVDQRTNTLLIQDTAEQVRDIMRTLDRLDVA